MRGRKYISNAFVTIATAILVSSCGFTIDRKFFSLHSESQMEALTIYQNSVYSYVRANCIDCHKTNVRPLFAADDLEGSLNSITPYLNSTFPSDSILVRQAMNGHCNQRAECLTDGTALTAQITSYFAQLAALDSNDEFLSTSFPYRTAEIPIPAAVYADSAYHLVTWDMSGISPLLSGSTFEVEVRRFDSTTYILRRPRLVTASQGVHIKDVRILLNGSYNPANNHFTTVDRVVPAISSGYLSTALPIIAQGTGPGDVLGFAFMVVEAGSLPSFDTSGLVSFWKFDETTGTRMDSKGTNHLTSVGVTQTSGFIGSGAHFDGTQLLSLADPPTLRFGKQDFSTSGWVNFDSTLTNMGLWGKGNSGNGLITLQEWALFFAPGSGISWMLSDGTNQCQVIWRHTPQTKTWYFIAAWYDATAETINLQVNAEPIETFSCTSGPSNRGNIFSMGRAVDNLFIGKMDSIGVWSKVLSPAQRAELYGSGLGSFFPF